MDALGALGLDDHCHAWHHWHAMARGTWVASKGSQHRKELCRVQCRLLDYNINVQMCTRCKAL